MLIGWFAVFYGTSTIVGYLMPNPFLYIWSVLFKIIQLGHKDKWFQVLLAQSPGAVEYTDCFSAEGQDSPNECPGYDTKQSDSEVPIELKLWRDNSPNSIRANSARVVKYT